MSGARRVAVDTHVLLASLLGGEARLVMRYWWEGKVALVLSEEIVEEYLAALARVGDAKAGARELMEAFGGAGPLDGQAGRPGKGKVVWVEGKGGGDRPEDGAPTGKAAGPSTSLRVNSGTPALQSGPTGLRPALVKFVEAAVAGKAEAMVALDPELVERGGWKGIPILTPGGFLESMARQEERPTSGLRRRLGA